MPITRIAARQALGNAEGRLRALFSKACDGRTVDAVYLDLSKNTVFGVAGLPFAAPLALRLLNDADTARYFAKFEGSSLILFDDTPRHLTETGEVIVPDGIRDTLCRLYRYTVESAGHLDDEGDHIIDLKAERIGTHFDVNLLIGNRIGYASPLLTTPKGAIDSLGRGSFRGTAARQVTGTRYGLVPEENGEPANRQFYLIEDGEVRFYSADTAHNVKAAVCRHSRNHTVITYETECGLRITRTLFILPQEEGMPEATEAQTVSIENLTGICRRIKIVFTGMFGLVTPESMLNDTIYGGVTWESGVFCRDGLPIAVSPAPHPNYLKPFKRFAMLLADGGFLEEYSANYLDFIGNGSLERPQNAVHLSSAPMTKFVPFFAVAKTLELPKNGRKDATLLTGMTITQDGSDQSISEMLLRLADKYSAPDTPARALEKVKAFTRRYGGFLHVRSGNRNFDAYVNNNLPFQVYYQSYVSRSFAWTQKSYREIGFREIQDMFASLYYIIGMGEAELAREMLGGWIANVYEMGYANHNFYGTGKEPGVSSDDGLWLLQAIHRYVSLTGDTAFLSEKFPVAGSDKTRTLFETLVAVVTYSGEISVGAHGLPILDRADWNDCLQLDEDWIGGKEKERLYREQLEKSGAPYGTPFENHYSESVMNGFLLKVAYDDLCSLAALAGESGVAKAMKEKAEVLTERLQTHAWKGDFFARALIGGGRRYTYLGAAGDGLGFDPDIDGSYYLNSFSWSILAGVATEEQIGTMLSLVEKHLVTDAGLKLCTPADLGRLAGTTASGSYFPGDRENGGAFKHAAMMAAASSVKAAREVRDTALANRLAALAETAMAAALPYLTMEHPYLTKGNPRFCTQYNNTTTGENVGPMLSGTASWLCLCVIEQMGVCFTGDKLVFSPVLPREMTRVDYTLHIGDSSFDVTVTKPEGFARVGKNTVFLLDGKVFDGRLSYPAGAGHYNIDIKL